MDLFLAAGGGFLVAVIWMDLMFDTLALRAPAGELPEESLALIAGYYRRVTTTASPMNLLVSAVMAAMVAVLVYEIARVPGAAASASLLLALCGVPIVWRSRSCFRRRSASAAAAMQWSCSRCWPAGSPSPTLRASRP